MTDRTNARIEYLLAHGRSAASTRWGWTPLVTTCSDAGDEYFMCTACYRVMNGSITGTKLVLAVGGSPMLGLQDDTIWYQPGKC